ncbi:hypothetical protein, partial [Marinobacter sp. ELB17]|uniref:hypothetical protein n=1 Tax=Marinobacter sp. ELB17 TaxID=270374 RepID=UPI0000F37CE3
RKRRHNSTVKHTPTNNDQTENCKTSIEPVNNRDFIHIFVLSPLAQNELSKKADKANKNVRAKRDHQN